MAVICFYFRLLYMLLDYFQSSQFPARQASSFLFYSLCRGCAALMLYNSNPLHEETYFKNKIITMFVLCTFPSYAPFSLNVSPRSCLGLKFFNFNIHQGKININRCKQEKE